MLLFSQLYNKTYKQKQYEKIVSNYFTWRMPTKKVTVLEINTLCASLASVSISVLLSPVALLLSRGKFSSGAMLRTTEPTIKLTTGKGPVERNCT